MILPDWLEKILTSSVTWIVTAIVLPGAISRIPKARAWFVAEPWRLAAASGALAAILVSLVGSLALKPMAAPQTIKVTSYPVGDGGVEDGINQPAVWTDTGTKGIKGLVQIPKSEDAQICTFTDQAYGPTGGNCILRRNGEGTSWMIKVQGSAQCRVTCFILTIAK
jgi:hypothetical protein